MDQLKQWYFQAHTCFIFSLNKVCIYDAMLNVYPTELQAPIMKGQLQVNIKDDLVVMCSSWSNFCF